MLTKNQSMEAEKLGKIKRDQPSKKSWQTRIKLTCGFPAGVWPRAGWFHGKPHDAMEENSGDPHDYVESLSISPAFEGFSALHVVPSSVDIGGSLLFHNRWYLVWFLLQDDTDGSANIYIYIYTDMHQINKQMVRIFCTPSSTQLSEIYRYT